MKYILAEINHSGETIGYWIEKYDNNTQTLKGYIDYNSQERDAKMYSNYEVAVENCKLIREKCDMLLQVQVYYEDTSIYNNKNDYHELQRIISGYPVEELAKVINYALMKNECVKLTNELNCLNAGIRPNL